MSSTGLLRYMTNKITAADAALEVRTVGFVPKRVVVQNETSLARVEWTEAMDDDSAFKTVNHDTAQRSLETSDGITPLTGENPGFQIGNLADINDTTTEILVWEAWG